MFIPFLAEASIVQILIGLAFVVFWAGAQLLAWLSKQQKKSPRTQPQTVPRQQQGPPPRGPQPPQRRNKKPRQPVTPPPLQPQRRAPVVVREPEPAVVAAAGPSKNDRLRALLRPANLKSEFILTEILQKPVGLRDEIR